MTWAAAGAIAIALLTLALIVTRPRGLSEGVSALLGGGAMMLTGLVSPSAAFHAEWSEWNVFLFFLGMMAIAGLADQSGVLDLTTYAVARLAHHRVVVLYLAVFALGIGITVAFANDTAALVLTPIVYALVVRLRLDPLPFVFATTFIADTASMALPVSNPLNVIVADSFGLGLGAYVGRLWLPTVVVIAVNVIVFLLLYRRGLQGRFAGEATPARRSGEVSTGAMLGALAVAYLGASALRLPLGMVAAVGALLIGINLARLGLLDLARLRLEMSWAIFGFLAGMVLVVRGLADAGVTVALGQLLARAAGGPEPIAIGATVFGTAIGANLINNLPMALVMVSTLHAMRIAATTRMDLVYATILGSDLGPNLTHLGSLATFLWLFFLRRKGVDVSAWDYFRVGIIVTPVMLLAATVGLWVTSSR